MAKEGMLAGLAQTQIFGIPVGAAATGALIAGAWDGVAGLAGGMIPQVAQWPWLVPAIGSVVTARFLPRFVGAPAANVGALLLAYDAMQGMVNLRGMVSGLFTRFRTTTSQAVGTPAPQGTPDTVDQYLKSKGY
jgi:hypothetical protein